MNKIGSCGLACLVCSARENECQGCKPDKAANCDIKACCLERGLEGCYDCDDYPCDKDMFNNIRVCAFIECAKEVGEEGLADRLLENHQKGIIYHPKDGSKGAYDQLSSKEAIKRLVYGHL